MLLLLSFGGDFADIPNLTNGGFWLIPYGSVVCTIYPDKSRLFLYVIGEGVCLYDYNFETETEFAFPFVLFRRLTLGRGLRICAANRRFSKVSY